MLRTTFQTAVFALVLVLALPATWGCDIPVFRYALDRWPADGFRLEAPAAVLQAEPLASEIRNLNGGAGLNLEVVLSTNGTRLYFPAHVRGVTTPVWEGELSPAVYNRLTDSPARQEVIRRILGGNSAVWVLVESQDRDRNEAAARLLAERLRFLESATGLPPLDPNDPSNQLGPGPELRVQLSFLRVRQDDPEETALVSMLAGPTGLRTLAAKESFVAVVFGRGRVLGAWPAARLSEEFIEEVTRFVTGSCSCEVKNQNPGWDLLLRVDWEAALKEADRARRAVPGNPAARPGERLLPPAEPVKPETVIFAPRTSEPASRSPRVGFCSQTGWLVLGAGVLAAGLLFLRKP